MRKALKSLTLENNDVEIEFEPVSEISLEVGDGRHSACIIDPAKINEEA